MKGERIGVPGEKSRVEKSGWMGYLSLSQSLGCRLRAGASGTFGVRRGNGPGEQMGNAPVFLSGLGSVADWLVGWLVGVTVRCYVYLIRGNDEAGRPGWPELMKKYGVLRSQCQRNWRCGWETETAGTDRDATGWQRFLLHHQDNAGCRQLTACFYTYQCLRYRPRINERALTGLITAAVLDGPLLPLPYDAKSRLHGALEVGFLSGRDPTRPAQSCSPGTVGTGERLQPSHRSLAVNYGSLTQGYIVPNCFKCHLRDMLVIVRVPGHDYLLLRSRPTAAGRCVVL